jgi:small conductance mechanosensitive channel
MDFDDVVTWATQSGVRILIIILIAFVAYRLLGVLTRYLSEQVQGLDEVEGSDLDKRTETIFRVIHSSGTVIIVGTGLLMVLTELGVSITPVLASVGVVGLAFGLGAQTLVGDMISGLFILMENQYTVGDTVELGGIIGTVEEMTLRATIIRDVRGAIHFVPNGEIRIVGNRSRDWSRAIVDVGITYAEDVDSALTTLREIANTLFSDEEQGVLLLEEPTVTGVEGLEDWAVRLRIMVRTKPEQQWGVQRYLRRQIHLVFAEKGIDLAFPRQDVMLLSRETEA